MLLDANTIYYFRWNDQPSSKTDVIKPFGGTIYKWPQQASAFDISDQFQTILLRHNTHNNYIQHDGTIKQGLFVTSRINNTQQKNTISSVIMLGVIMPNVAFYVLFC